MVIAIVTKSRHGQTGLLASGEFDRAVEQLLVIKFLILFSNFSLLRLGALSASRAELRHAYRCLAEWRR
jgi:hypothetical protein